MKKIIIQAITILIYAGTIAQAQDLNKKIDNLGGNKDILKRAKALDPDNKIRVVQNRTVDRNWRLELGVNYGLIAGGDPYLSTQNIGGNLDLHINPLWSIGARYCDFYNELTSEGKRVYNDAQNRNNFGNPYVKPAVDYPMNSMLGVVSFYPVYGKLNMFDLGVAQFDIYVLGGYGQAQFRSEDGDGAWQSGSSPSWTAGGGVGLWLSQHFSSRLEVRYQAYQDKIYSGARDVDFIISTFSIGFIL